MRKLNTVTVGLAFAGTAAALNVVCTVAVMLWPDGMIAFANSWAHGVDLKIIKATAPISAGGVIYGLMGLALVSFVVGAVFAWIYNALNAERR
jgi:hypothetical protein